jgi:hypothetical protein
MAVLHNLSLLVHLLCLVVYGASGFGGLVLDRSLWAAVDGGRDTEALAFAKTAAMLGRASQFAAILTLLSGLGMLASTNFVQWGQHWLYGKVALFLALGAYGGAVGGRSGRRLVEVLSQRAAGQAGQGAQGELQALRATFGKFHVIMLGMLTAVLALAAVRP